MTYEEFQQLLAQGRIRKVYDENGGSSYFMYDENGATPMPGFTPPQAPAPLSFDNLGGGLNTPLTSGGTPVYATTNLGADGNWQNAQSNYYLRGDPNMPAGAAPAVAGGYSVDNGATGLASFLEPLVIGGLAGIGGGALGPALAGASGVTSGAGVGAISGGIGGTTASGISSGGDLEAMLQGGAIGAAGGAALGTIFGPPSANTMAEAANPGDFYTSGAGAFSGPGPTTLQELLSQSPQDAFDLMEARGIVDNAMGPGQQARALAKANPEWSAQDVLDAMESRGIVAPGMGPEQAARAAGQVAQYSQPFTGGGLKVSSDLPTGGLDNVIAGSNMASGATGITPGVTASAPGMEGLGAGLSVPGVTGMGTTGAIGTAGLGLGAGALTAEAVGGSAPAALGGTGAATVAGPAAAAATAAGAGIGATKLSDVLSGDVGIGDLAGQLTLSDAGKIAGTGLATVGSVLAQQDIANKQDALAREYMGFGAPSRARYEASFAPGFDITAADPAFKGALDASTDSLLRKGSVGGNPYGNPGVLAEILKYTTGNVALPYLKDYRNQNAATGGFGAFSTAAPGAATNSINATGSMYSDVAGGLADILNPRRNQKQVNLNVSGLV